jgi:hypothetical protein
VCFLCWVAVLLLAVCIVVVDQILLKLFFNVVCYEKYIILASDDWMNERVRRWSSQQPLYENQMANIIPIDVFILYASSTSPISHPVQPQLF